MFASVQSLASLSRLLRLVRRAGLVAAVPVMIAAGCATEPAATTGAEGERIERSSVGTAPAMAAQPLADVTKVPRFHKGIPEGALIPDAFCNNNGPTAGYGSGADGAFAPAASATWSNARTSATATAGTPTITVASTAGFAVGNLVLIHQTQGTNAGTWEIASVTAVGATSLTVALPLLASYTAKAQVVRVSQFTTVSIPAGVTISATPWNGTTGGIVAFVATGAVTIAGHVSADGAGFQGGPGDGGNNGCGGAPSKVGFAGESSLGLGVATTNANGAGGGGGGTSTAFCCSGCATPQGTNGDSGGGGGGYGTAGAAGQGGATVGAGGAAVGTADLSTLFFGGGGGGGGGNCGASSPAGGAGGGVVLISAPAVTIAAAAQVSARGAASIINAAGNWEGAGGGGAGGAIVLSTAAATIASDGIDASGGVSTVQCAGASGAGGVGVVRVSCGTFNGAACPTSAGADVVPTPDVTAFCSFSTCTSSASCPVTAPSCVASTRLCVQCQTSADCAGNTNGTICDTSKDTCGTCTAASAAACTGTKPVCNTSGTNDLCSACNGNQGTAATLPCPSAALPVCVLSGASAGACVQCTTAATCAGTTPVCSSGDTCVACNGDNGTAATNACASSAAPYCNANGSCGACTSDAQCGAGHAGPFCNVATGACGTACFTDPECGAGNWCDTLGGPGVCTPRTTNGNPVPGGSCGGDGGSSIGARACLSGACDAKDNACGYANGDGPCTAAAPGVCRSTLCQTTGSNAGLCEECLTSSTCAATTPVCDTTSDTCVVCNGDNGMAVSDPCSSSAAPNCTGGQCGKCTSDAQCGSGHAGPFCDTSSGTCGTTCSTDAQCGAGSWCNNLSGPGACQAQTSNGIQIPGGTCTQPLGARACLSGVCDTDNACGYANGDGPCSFPDGGTDGTLVCRSTLCATSGPAATLCVQCLTSATCGGTTPVCSAANDTCVPCNGDDGTAASNACPSSAAPNCNLLTGACGKCTNDLQCGLGHAGPFCDTASGACGSACTTDVECGAGSWCNNLSGPGICQVQTNNGLPVPGGSCTGSGGNVGSRACVSGACDTNDNACGYKNGDGPCGLVDGGNDGTLVCRSGLCATSGAESGLCIQCASSAGCSGGTPVCDGTSDSCVACNGDNGSGATDACPSSAQPTCFAGGACGMCTSDAQCGPGNGGPFCNTVTGVCGTSCFVDAECGAGSWCDDLNGPGVCTPQTPNGTLIPGGTCSTGLGLRACVSGVCDTNDNDCGYANGHGPCVLDDGGVDGVLVCRSTICATTGANAGDCVQCTTSTDCSGATPVCNTATNTCVATSGGDAGGTTGQDGGTSGDGGTIIGGGGDGGGTGEDGGTSEDGGGTTNGDGGTTTDSGSTGNDGGGATDAGGADGGTNGDGGVTDGGTHADGGAHADAGGDGGAQVDASATDGGGQTADAGGDATAPRDSGTLPTDAGGGSDGSESASEDSGAAGGGVIQGGGCSCRTYGARETGSDGVLFAGFAALVLIGRRRRARRSGKAA